MTYSVYIHTYHIIIFNNLTLGLLWWGLCSFKAALVSSREMGSFGVRRSSVRLYSFLFTEDDTTLRKVTFHLGCNIIQAESSKRHTYYVIYIYIYIYLHNICMCVCVWLCVHECIMTNLVITHKYTYTVVW